MLPSNGRIWKIHDDDQDHVHLNLKCGRWSVEMDGVLEERKGGGGGDGEREKRQSLAGWGPSFATGAVGVWAGSMECFSERPTPKLELMLQLLLAIKPGLPL